MKCNIDVFLTGIDNIIDYYKLFCKFESTGWMPYNKFPHDIIARYDGEQLKNKIYEYYKK